jgi:hypothetical protein
MRLGKKKYYALISTRTSAMEEDEQINIHAEKK